MSYIRKFAYNKNIISLIFTSFLSLSIFYFNDSIYVNNLKTIVIDSFAIISKPSSWYHNILIVKEENKMMSEKIIQLSLLNSKLINYEIENKKLRDILNYKESFKNLSLLPANILNSDYSMSLKSNLINVGLNDGVTKNMSVLDIFGNLVGKVYYAGHNNSNIQLITDNNFSVSIKVGNNISIGQFKPTFGKYGQLEGIIKTSDIQEGDIIYTSGISEIYPPDIPIAKVVSNIKKQNKLFQDIAVEILTDINNLYYVFVIQ